MILRAQRKSARHRHAARVTDAEFPSGHPQRCGGLRRAARKSYFRHRARRPAYHYVGEGNACTEANADCLEHCLFGGEPSRQPLNPIDPVADLIQFRLYKAAWNQRVARILDPALHLGDAHQVNAMSYNNGQRIRLSLGRHMTELSTPRSAVNE